MSSFMRAKTCCGCYTPKAGILILSALAIISSTLNFIWLVKISVGDHYNFEQFYGMDGDFRKFFSMFSMIMQIMNIITRSLLIMGVMKDKPSLMFPAVCIDFTGIYLFLPITSISLMIFTLPHVPIIAGFFMISIFVLVLFLLSHWFFLLYHYYDDLRSKNFEVSSKDNIYSSKL